MNQFYYDGILMVFINYDFWLLEKYTYIVHIDLTNEKSRTYKKLLLTNFPYRWI